MPTERCRVHYLIKLMIAVHLTQGEPIGALTDRSPTFVFSEALPIGRPSLVSSENGRERNEIKYSVWARQTRRSQFSQPAILSSRGRSRNSDKHRINCRYRDVSLDFIYLARYVISKTPYLAFRTALTCLTAAVKSTDPLNCQVGREDGRLYCVHDAGQIASCHLRKQRQND